MQENEFEKKVREELGGLRLRPSGVVWENVEAQLKKRKKRRVVVFMFMLAGLGLLGYSGYFLINSQKQVLVEQKSTLSNTGESQRGNSNSESLSSHAESENADKINAREISKQSTEEVVAPSNSASQHKPADINDVSKQNLNTSLATSKPSANQVVEKNTISTGKTTKPKKKTASQSSVIGNATAVKKSSSGRPDSNKSLQEVDSYVANASGVNKVDEQQKAVMEPQMPSIAAADSTATLIADNGPSVSKDSVSVVSVPGKEIKPNSGVTKKGFSWGLLLSGGVSNSADEMFTVAPMSQQTADAMYSSPGPSNNLSNSFSPPSSIRRGAAFKIGAIAEKQFTKRSSIIAGLQYAYLSNHIKTGSYKDTTVVFALRTASQPYSVNSVYAGKHDKEYKNEFHLLQLPVSYQWQVNKGEKVPMLWNVGITAGYLIKTNALVYDTTAGGVYYRNNDAFQKMQLSVGTGFFFRFGKKNVTWSMGPEISLDMRRLLKDGSHPKQYMVYGGLTGRLLFSKKKK